MKSKILVSRPNKALILPREGGTVTFFPGAPALDAERIVVWAGGGAADASDAVADLAAHWSAPVLTSFAGRGIAALERKAGPAPISNWH